MVSTSSSIPLDGLTLRGWPVQTSKPESLIERAAILLTVNDQVIRDLQEVAKRGKTIKLLTGKNPKLQYGSTSLDLSFESGIVNHDIYSRSATSNELNYAASVTQKATLAATAPRDTLTATDDALATLKNSLASFAQEKEAKQTTISSAVIPSNKANKILSNRYVSSRDSHPASPLPNHALHHLAPTSAPLADRDAISRTKAMTHTLSHLLSTGPRTESDIFDLTKIPASKQSEILSKIAELDTNSQKWALRDRAYKDLDVWKFPFKKEERDASVDNAVRAFDRLRLAKDDKLWQHLLPESERGKGKCLSRLHNNQHLAPLNHRKSPLHHSGPIDHSDTEDKQKDGRLTPFSAVSTPMARSSSGTGKSTTIEKRLKESQKQRAAEEAKMAKQKTKDAKTATITNNDAMTKKKYKSEEVVKESDDENDSMTNTSKVKSVKAPLSQQRRDRGAKSPAGTSSSEGRPLSKVRTPVIKSAAAGKSTPLHQPDKTPNPTPSQRVEKHGQRLSAVSPRPVDDNRKAQGKPKAVSPLGHVSPSAGTLFGGHSKTSSVIKRAVPAHGHKSSLSTTSIESHTKRPASRDATDNERPSKAARTSASVAQKSKATQPSMTASERPPKRKIHDSLERDSFPTKHRRTESSSTLAMGSSSSSANSHTTTAQTSVASPSPPTLESWLTARSPSVTSSGSDPLKISWERALDDAEKFRTVYYPAYQKLYDRIKSMNPRDVTREDTVKLWKMHDRLKEMKREISNAVQD